MTKKQQLNDDLFGGISLDDLENQLITVDVEENIEFSDDDNGDAGAGGGDPGDDQKKRDKEPREKPKEDFIIVDTGKDIKDEKDPDDDENKKEDKKPVDTKGGSAPDKESDSPVYLHAAALQENGVLPNFDLKTLENLDPADAIVKINEHIQLQINDSIKEGVDEYKNNLGEKALNFLKALEDGVPFEDMAENYTLEERFGSITEKSLEQDEELAEAVYKDFLHIKGFNDAKVSKFVATAKANDELIAEASEGLTEIKAMIVEERETIKKNAVKEKQEREEKNNKIKQDIEKNVTSVKEILPGVQVSEQEKKELIKYLTVPVRYAEGANGQKIPVSKAMDLRSKNPIAYELRLNYLISKGFFDEDLKNLKLETFMKKSETSATKKLIEKISKESSLGGGKTTIGNRNGEEKSSFIFPQNISL